MKKIITTVGISLFSNYMDDRVRNYYGRNYSPIDVPYGKTKNCDSSDIYKDNFKSYIQSIREKIEDYWYEYQNTPNQYASAEIASLLKITEEEPSETFEVYTQ